MAKEYIERDALLADLAKRYCEPCEAEGKDHNHVRCRACWVDDMMGEIGDAPFAADVVEVVHGRWEYLQDDEWRCSNCHTVFNTGGKWIPMTDNFCSECGADMRERRDDNAD